MTNVDFCLNENDMMVGDTSNDPDEDEEDLLVPGDNVPDSGVLVPGDNVPESGVTEEILVPGDIVPDATREDVIYVDITDADTGACGVKPEAASHTQVSFYVEAKYNVSLITSEEVADQLQDEMGPTTICSVIDGPYIEDDAEMDTDMDVDSNSTLEIQIEPNDSTMAHNATRRRHLQQTDVVGYEPCGPDYEPYGELCESDEPGIICERFTGQVCIYCDPSLSTPECYTAGLGLIRDNAAAAADPPAITDVKFVGGSMSTEPTSGGLDVIGDGGAQTSSVIVDTKGTEADGGNGLGIALGIGLGVCALLVLLLAVRKNRQSTTKEISFLDDEDLYSDYGDDDKIHLDPGDSSFDGTEIMSDSGSPSPSKWRKARPGHIVGEDDSVLSGSANGNRSFARDLMMTEEFQPADVHDLARGGSGVDVHQCNSAMCEICLSQGRNPRFVPTTLEDIEIEAAAADNSLNSSGLSYASRSYPMEDTVDF